MANNNNMKRNRNNNNRRRSGSNVNRAHDSTGPEVKIRGTVTQIYDKYQALARDAQTSGDRVRAESLLQHAEHYYRLIKSAQAQNPQTPNTQSQNPQSHSPQTQGTPTPTNDKPPVENNTPKNDIGEGAPSGRDSAPEADAPTSAEGQRTEKPAPRKRRRRPRAENSEQPIAVAEETAAATKTPPGEAGDSKEDSSEVAAE